MYKRQALNYLAKQKNDFGFPINDVCRFHLKNGADIDDIAINANVSEIGFKRSFGVMVNYRYELAKIENSELLDKKMVEKPAEESTLDLKGKSTYEELEIYLNHIKVADVEAVMNEYRSIT